MSTFGLAAKNTLKEKKNGTIMEYRPKEAFLQSNIYKMIIIKQCCPSIELEFSVASLHQQFL